jgi:hypothetical protein
MTYILQHQLGNSIKLQTSTGRDIFTYDYSSAPKPFIHPLYTPAGHLLTNYQPKDHYWHRGLWFTIKFVNGVNFWEENGDDYGAQVTLRPPDISHDDNKTATITSDLEWRRPSGDVLIVEHRVIRYQEIDYAAYVLDFETALTAQADLLLDRTPFTTWGGYGGLVLRGNRSCFDSRILFPDGSTTDRPKGFTHNWGDLSGDFDGGREESGGVAIFDHPSNPRHPSPWYGGTGTGLYLNAAFLFHEPMQVPANDVLSFKYRVLVHDGVPDAESVNEQYKRYVG